MDQERQRVARAGRGSEPAASSTAARTSPSQLPFRPATVEWFSRVFDQPTVAQARAWPHIAAGESTLLLAPTGSGKTLAAFLVAIDRIMFGAPGDGGLTDADARAHGRAHALADAHAGGSARRSVRVLYVSPLKALGVDVERNLMSPLAGIRAAAEGLGHAYHDPTVAVRSGDTPPAARAQLVRKPPDLLITTPESLYLLMTSKGREGLAHVETVIVDEIHSLVSNKRGAHLFVTLERLEQLRRQQDPGRAPLQRIGLSATQRPLDEVARLLGGAEATANSHEPVRPRPVVVVEAGRRKQLDLTIDVPVDDMARLDQPSVPSGPAAAGPSLPSIWPSIHPRLVELIRQHRSTMVFVNSRRLAERLATAINDVAGQQIALAHHGSLAKETRLQIEDRLKRGQLPAIVATSSLELGIDMGAVDLVIQVEAPPSIASGVQRIGRAGHQVNASSKGIIFPKYRGDLVACAAAAGRMAAGEIEETFYPRCPLDVLAQQLVAMVALGPQHVDQLYATVRAAAPLAELTRGMFDNVLDLLAGRYPSDEFAELRARLNWDRVTGEVTPRRGTQRLAVLNAGTIADRGLYGVYLAEGDSAGRVAGSSAGGLTGGRRVGELDEEMVFELRPGEVFLLGASSWRVMDITKDRVLVAPAPGEPGRMPFWHGDGPGRPLEFGRAIGALVRHLARQPAERAEAELLAKHSLDVRAAKNLLDYLREQADATDVVPSDKTIVVECFVDEIGDWRVAILSPFGARVHAPWAMAVLGRMKDAATGEIDMMWTDDGMMFRLPESDAPPELSLLFPRSDEVEDQVVKQLGTTALFASRFRENAARALLLPRQRPGKRTPLWLQRRRAADLLSVASRYPSFPILLETYRECLRDVFDIRGLKDLLRDVESRRIHVRQVQTPVASPFTSTLMFSFVGNFIYQGDAPLAERRAATLALDQAQLRELLGDAELRELIDADAVELLALELQRLDGKFPVQNADGLHDLLLYVGDLTRDEIAARCEDPKHGDVWLSELVARRQVLELKINGQTRYVAAEDAARFRDALGVVLPPGLPAAFVENVADPVGDLVSRFARTHVPFKPEELAARLGLGVASTREALGRLVEQGRVLLGEFLPGGHGYEYCDTEVLRKLKRRSLAKLRQQIEPVDPDALGRFLPRWHGLDRPRSGLDGLLDAIEQLQGLPLPASDLEQSILPARISDYRPADLDELCAAGEIIWQGVNDLGVGDGRVALYLTDQLPNLIRTAAPLAGDLADRLRRLLAERGALFFVDIERAVGQFRHELLDALWDLVWNGEVTNDTLTPLRSLRQQNQPRRGDGRSAGKRFRSRRLTLLPGSEGRWSLIDHGLVEARSATERQAALANQLLLRYGIVTRELVASEGHPGGFSGLYPVLKAMEESGRIRRGYFIAGQGAAQFALPGADDRLRERIQANDDAAVMILAANDPANPYGTALRWPASDDTGAGRPGRAAASRVVLVGGSLAGYISRAGNHLRTFLPADEPARHQVAEPLASALAGLATASTSVFFEKIDGQPASRSSFARLLEQRGFVSTSRGLLHRRVDESRLAQRRKSTE